MPKQTLLFVIFFSAMPPVKEQTKKDYVLNELNKFFNPVKGKESYQLIQ